MLVRTEEGEVRAGVVGAGRAESVTLRLPCRLDGSHGLYKCRLLVLPLRME